MTWIEKLQEVLDSWEGTPYGQGSGCRGVATDCVGFVIGVLDQLHGIRNRPFFRYAQDLGWHNPRLAMKFSLQVSASYPHSIVRDWQAVGLEPGDVITAATNGSSQRGVGHVLIAGYQPNTIWHSTCGAGVCWTGIDAVRRSIVRVWRGTEREKWPCLAIA